MDHLHNSEIKTFEPIQLNWDDVETVFLDMDGTLLDLHYDNHFWLEHLPKKYAEIKRLTLEESRAFLTNKTTQIEGTLNWYSIDYWSDQLDIDIPTLKHEVAHKVAFRDEAENFLTHLNNLGKRVVLLTNAHQRTLDIKFNYVSLAHYFDRIITSHELETAKEEEGFWQKMHGIEDFDRKSSLFIDDNLDVLNAAYDHGVEHLYAIHQPDSQKPPKDTGRYTAIECFSQIM